MERTWRWFGKKDKITLAQLRQIGVEGIVTALHDVPLGEVWTREKIRDLREYIESYGMRWSVVESSHGHNAGYTLLGRMFAMGQVQGILATVDREMGIEYKQPGFFD